MVRNYTTIVILLIALAGCQSAGVIDPQVPDGHVAVTVSGLPDEMLATLWAVKPADGGGYQREREVGTLTGSGTQYIEVGEATHLDTPPVTLPAGVLTPTPRFHQVDVGTREITVTYRKQFSINTSTHTLFASPTGDPPWPPPKAEIRILPQADPRLYDAGAQVQVEAIPPEGMKLMWWVIYETPNSSSKPEDFTSAESTLTLVVDGPKNVLGRFVNHWFRRPQALPDEDHIVVHVIAPNQQVRLLDGDQVVVEAISNADHKALLPVPTGSTLRGRFEITAPNRDVVVFTSPIYTDLQAGDVFQ